MDSSEPWSAQAPPMVENYAPSLEHPARSSIRYASSLAGQQSTPFPPPPPTISSGTSKASHLAFNDTTAPLNPSYFPPAPPPFTILQHDTSFPPPSRSSSFISSFHPVQSTSQSDTIRSHEIRHRTSSVRSNNIEINLQADFERRSPVFQKHAEESNRNQQSCQKESFRNPDSPYDLVIVGHRFNNPHSNGRELGTPENEVISKEPNREAKRQVRSSDVVDPEEHPQRLGHPEDFTKKLGITKLSEEINDKEQHCKETLEDNLRCNLCPSPGFIKQHEKGAHVQVVHFSYLFVCAACSGKGFEEFDDIIVHINNEHQVTDTEMVLETIKLPEGLDKLKMWRCGVTNCRKKFVGLSELVLKSHMHNKHGSYYLKVGKGKYIQRFCRICGDNRSFGSEQDLDHHIVSSHPHHQFAPSLDSDSETGSDIIEIVRIKQEPGEKRSAKSPMKSPIPIFGEPIPVETNRILQETSHLIKDPPIIFEEQKKRILGDPMHNRNRRKYNDKYVSPKPTFGEPFPENYLQRSHLTDTGNFPISVECKIPFQASGSTKPALNLPLPRSARRSLTPEKAVSKISKTTDTRKIIAKRRNRRSPSSSSTSESSSGIRSPSPKQRKGKKTVNDNKPVKVRKMSTKQIKACLDGLADREEKIKKKVVQSTTKQEEILTNQNQPSYKNVSSSLFSNAIHQIEQQHRGLIVNKTFDKIDIEQALKKSPNLKCLPEMFMPKFMLDGKPAYYICELCQEPVGTAFAWIKHRIKRKSHLALYTKEYSKSKDVKEVHISSNPSILEKFGDKNKICLPCNKSFMNNNALRIHEDESEHKTKLVTMELKDCAELKSSGGQTKTLFYCDICEEAISSHPAVHVKEYSHVAKLKATKRCYYCTKRFHRRELMSHINQHHLRNLFKCTVCSSKMMTKVKMLDHVKTHIGTKEKVDFTFPTDLRMMKCGVCSEGIYMSQDTSEAMNHVLNEHPEIKNITETIKFGCQACPQLVFENDDIMNKHVNGFHQPGLAQSKPKETCLIANSGTDIIQNQKQVGKTKKLELDHFYVTRKKVESNLLIPHETSSKSKISRRDISSSRSTSTSRSRSSSRSRSRSRIEKKNEKIPRSKRSRSRSNRHQGYREEVQEGLIDGRKLFVRGLSKDTEDHDLKRHFEQWGRLTDYIVMKDSYGSRGFGFVTFAKSEDLDYCMECRAHWINNKQVDIGDTRPLNASVDSRGRFSRSPRRRRASNSPSTSRGSRSRQKEYTRSPRISRRSRSRKRMSPLSPRTRRRSRSRQRITPTSPRTSRSSRSRQRIYPASPRTSRRSRSEQRMLRSDERGRDRVTRPELVRVIKSPSEKRIILMRNSSEEPNKEDASVCPFCQEGFSQQERMVEHMNRSHSSKMFHCDLCHKYSGWNRENLLEHLTSVHGKQTSMTKLLKNYTLIPSKLHRINCKLCQPPHILGSQGFWLANNLTNKMKNILDHFLTKHSIKEVTAATSMLELACRGCDTTYSYGDRYEWIEHVEMDHSRISTPPPGKGHHKGMAAKIMGKKCDYCDKSITATDIIRHIKEVHSEETFLCKICLSKDKSCFPYFDKIKEMMSHMVLKHGNEFSSYYDHIIYPKNLGWMRCMLKGCESRGKFMAYNRDLLKEHGLFYHSGITDRKFMAIHCRNCDGVKDQFEDATQLKEHIELKHKQIVAWKVKNGHN